jgi:chemotaxis protein MotB
MARKKKHEEHENHERWLVSYADFITLLFAFFVVMYAVSSVNEGKYRVLSESLVAAFRSPTKSMDPIQVGHTAKSPFADPIDFRKSPVAISLPNLPMPRYDSPQPRPKVKTTEEELHEISDAIQKALAPMIDKHLIHVRVTKHWVEVEINTSILFPSGSASLSQEALPTLEKLAQTIKELPNTVYVEGFTDNVPINTLIFPSNWELSAGRAASVVHVFMKAGVEPGRMVAVGYGEYRAVADNSTEEGRRKNRRVVLVIQSTADTQKMVKELQEAEGGSEPRAAESEPDDTQQQNNGTEAGSRPTDEAGAIGLHKFPVIPPPIRLPFVPVSPKIVQPLERAARSTGSRGVTP